MHLTVANENETRVNVWNIALVHVEYSHLCLFVLEVRELRPALLRDAPDGRVVGYRGVQGGDVLRDRRLVLQLLVAAEAVLFSAKHTKQQKQQQQQQQAGRKRKGKQG